jgi:hypothetical protein
LSTRRGGGRWIDEDNPPRSVAVFATLSLVLWLSVVTAGRFMAYV